MSSRERERVRRAGSRLIGGFLGVLTVSVLLVGMYEVFIAPPRNVNDLSEVEIIIPPGLAADEIGSLLDREGLVDNAWAFKLLGKVGGYERRLQAGRYCLGPEMRDLDVLKVLARGRTGEERVTLPEGLTVAQMARLLAERAGIDGDRFLTFARDPRLADSLRVPAGSLEGYLFPDTYNIFWQMDERTILRQLVQNFWNHFEASRDERAAALGMSVHQVVTLASLIEREAKSEEERVLISGVFHNRLRLRRPLESCATVAFILPERRERLTYADLRTPSPYNTYLRPGLPPGPICSPGISSIDAALYPAETDYLYFVSRGDGTHEFTKTAREHIRAKRKYGATP